jgi:hypothetical protein
MSPGHDEDIDTALSEPHTVNKMGTREESRPQDERPVFEGVVVDHTHFWPERPPMAILTFPGCSDHAILAFPYITKHVRDHAKSVCIEFVRRHPVRDNVVPFPK